MKHRAMNILTVGAHPDVIELVCSGTLAQDRETAWLCPADDARELAADVTTVIDDGAAVRRTTERARAWIEEHATVERMPAETAEFHRSALQEENT